MSEPKPCPFCGSSDVGGAGGQVYCRSCPAVIEVQNTNTFYAVELWNRRTDNHDLAAAQAEIAQLRGAVPALPPMPPKGAGLPRYGIRWEGHKNPLTVPMVDGYWTPHHLAVAAVRALTDKVRRLEERIDER